MKTIRILVITFWVLVAAHGCRRENEFSTWRFYRGDEGNHAYSALDQVNTGNVSKLEVAWTYKTGDASEGNRSAIQCNPVVVNNKMYVSSPQLKVIALDAATGKELWKFDPFEGARATGVNRGIAYWENDSQTDRRIFFSAGPFLYALDADTGKEIAAFGQNGKIDLRIGLGREPGLLSVWATSPGVVYNDILIQGTALGEGYDAAPGFIRAYDVRTGVVIWTFNTIPQPGEPNYDTWPDGAYREAGGTNSWAGMSIDKKRGIVFAPTGSPAFDFYGGNRKGKNLYGNCLLALDAATGKLKWHYQLVHHDLWDYDLPAPPNLVTVTRDGKAIDAVAQVTKMGMVFIFDRDTGEPIFPIEERPVPASDLLGEEVWKTQPFPLKPPPFSRQHFSIDEVTDISPEANEFVKRKIAGARMGPVYTPPSTQGVVQFPGTRGGAEWGGASVDPRTNIMYVNANDVPLLVRMKAVDLVEGGERIYRMNACTTCHGSDRKGTNVFPSLVNIAQRKSPKEIESIIKNGKGQMPAHPGISDGDMRALMMFLFDGKGKIQAKESVATDTLTKQYRYVHDGWNILTDENGYPGVKPPWGTLNAIDLNKGEILWKVPLGEYPELISKGLPPTGTQNLGGPVATAGGLVFIGATKDEMFRAFEKETGKVLWQYKLPAGGYATPSVYEVDGTQYIVIAAGGGGKVGSPSGDAYVAFRLRRE